jgi:hypothetical protein
VWRRWDLRQPPEARADDFYPPPRLCPPVGSIWHLCCNLDQWEMRCLATCRLSKQY